MERHSNVLEVRDPPRPTLGTIRWPAGTPPASKTYTSETLPDKFEIIFQSWDTANKATELADHSACTTRGFKKQNLYLLHVFRKKLDYPALKQAVRDQAQQWNAKNVIIEDKASGTQLIQELIYEGMHGVKK